MVNMLSFDLKPVTSLLRNSLRKYAKDDPIRLSGTTAFFLVLALAPILVFVLGIAGTLLSESTIQQQILQEAQNMAGPDGKAYLQTLMESLHRHQNTSRTNAVIGIVILLGISTTFFNVLQNSLNYIWRVRPKPRHNLLKILKDRLISFIIMLGIGVVMLITLLINAAIGLLDTSLQEFFPQVGIWVIRLLNQLLSYTVITFIFAMIYRFLPDAVVKWNVTWVGALITALLFTLGKYLIGFLLGNSGIGHIYGTAGSIVIVLMWLFYSSIIFYFGAEITHQFACMYARTIEPKKHAVAFEINEIAHESAL